MIFIYFLCIFTTLINYNFLSYNENLLLCIFFIIFFMLGYSVIKNIFKQFIFLKIFKSFFYIFLVLRLNNYFYKLLINFYTLKLNLLFRFINSIKLLKKKSIINTSSLFNYYYILLNLIYFFNLNKKFKLNKNYENYNITDLKKSKYHDQILFF